MAAAPRADCNTSRRGKRTQTGARADTNPRKLEQVSPVPQPNLEDRLARLNGGQVRGLLANQPTLLRQATRPELRKPQMITANQPQRIRAFARLARTLYTTRVASRHCFRSERDSEASIGVEVGLASSSRTYRAVGPEYWHL